VRSYASSRRRPGASKRLSSKFGGPLIFASAIAVLFGAYEQDGAHFVFAIPEIAFELSLTVYLIAKGFKPSRILDDAALAAP
jgi:hypothetical protein